MLKRKNFIKKERENYTHTLIKLKFYLSKNEHIYIHKIKELLLIFIKEAPFDYYNLKEKFKP